MPYTNYLNIHTGDSKVHFGWRIGHIYDIKTHNPGTKRVVRIRGFTLGSGGQFSALRRWVAVSPEGPRVTVHTVAMTMSRCAMSATRCMRSGAMRFRFSLAKSHDGKMCTVYIACNHTYHVSHCINALPQLDKIIVAYIPDGGPAGRR